MSSVSQNEPRFLIAVKPSGGFVMSVSANEIEVSDIPSAGQAFSDYQTADAVCRQLRKRGLILARVTNVLGEAVTIEMLRQSAPVTAKDDSLPKTQADIDRIPSFELKRRMKADPRFAERVHAIWARTTV